MDFAGRETLVKAVQLKLKLLPDGSDGKETWTAIAKHLDVNINQSNLVQSKLSPKALQLILDYEVGGGEDYYNKFLQRPTWPGAFSGVTIGIGYDLGYHTLEQFKSDWSDKLPPIQINRLTPMIGVKGKAARGYLSGVRDIHIPWAAALQVFESKTIPKYINQAQHAYPGIDDLKPDAFGALVSLIFNRGNSLEGKRRLEMLAIKSMVPRKDYKGIATELRKMKRLWLNAGVDGLIKRREEEASLVESCI